VDAAGMLLGFGSGGDVALVDPSTLIPTPITDMVQKSGDTMTGELGLPSAKFSGAIPTHSAGRVFYSTDENTLCYYNDVSGVTVNLGRELLIRVRNNTGSTILNGQVVYVSGALGQNPTAALAKADAEATSKLIGVATHDIPNNTIGYITGSGEVHDMDTSAFTDGQMVYLSAETAGAMTATAPVSPNYPVQVGVVLYAHGTQGKLLVSITRTAGTGGGSGTVTSVGITPGAGVTVSGSPVTSSGSITLGLDLKTVNGTSLLGSGNVTTPQGTVTSVGITGGTGIVVNNSPITSSGNMTVALASSGVVPGSYGSAAKTLAVTVDTTGRVTDISEADIAIAQSQVTNLVTALAGKQATLVSGTNIKSVNGSSLLGSGDLTVTGSSVFVNVKSFGATGDGVTDDTSSIQSAVDSLSPGDTLYFPPGTYLTRLILVNKTRVRITGSGATLKLYYQTAVNASTLTPYDISWIVDPGTTDFTAAGASSNTRGVTFYTSYPGQLSGTGTATSTTQSTVFLIVGRYGPSDYDPSWSAASDVTIDGLRFIGHKLVFNTSALIRIKNIQRVTIRDCTFEDHEHFAITWYAATDVLVADCKVRNCIQGVAYGQAGTGYLLERCVIRGNTVSGMWSSMWSTGGHDGLGACGIRLAGGSRDCKILDNIIDSGGALQACDCYVTRASGVFHENLLIRGNTWANTSWGASIAPNKGLIYANNHHIGNQVYGLELYSVGQSLVTDCIFDGYSPYYGHNVGMIGVIMYGQPETYRTDTLFNNCSWNNPADTTTTLTACRAVITSNTTLSGLFTVDGVALSAGDRVLVTEQTNSTSDNKARNNGIWIASSSAWSRASDTIRVGYRIPITSGTTYGGSTWQCRAEAKTVGVEGMHFTSYATSSEGIQCLDTAKVRVTNCQWLFWGLPIDYLRGTGLAVLNSRFVGTTTACMLIKPGTRDMTNLQVENCEFSGSTNAIRISHSGDGYQLSYAKICNNFLSGTWASALNVALASTVGQLFTSNNTPMSGDNTTTIYPEDTLNSATGSTRINKTTGKYQVVIGSTWTDLH
jgi:hypothetical protein